MDPGVKNNGDPVGLLDLAPEEVHLVALSGWLSISDVASLSTTCKRMADILVWDVYGKDVHYALLGVSANVDAGRWKAARYAVSRKWFVAWFVAGGVDETIVDTTMETTMETTMGTTMGTTMETTMGTTMGHTVGGTNAVGRWIGWRNGGWHGLDDDDLEYDIHAATSLWRKAAEAGVGWEDSCLAHNEESKRDWEEVVLGCLAFAPLAGPAGCLKTWGLTSCSAIKLSLLHVAAEVGSTRIVDWVLTHNGDVDLKNQQSIPPLVIACEAGHLGVAEALIAAGAGQSVEKDRGVWIQALMGAIQRGHQEMVSLLIRAGVDVDAPDWRGDFPLIFAAGNGLAGVVRVLIEEGGADVTKVGTSGSARGRTALQVAALGDNYDEIVELLKANNNQ